MKSMHWPVNKQHHWSEHDQSRKVAKPWQINLPEEADDSTCLEGVKFQGDLLPDLDEADQLCPLQEAHVENWNVQLCA